MFQVSLTKVGSLVKTGFNIAIYSQLLINLLISVSMKELLKAISILQFIAFLALVHIDYSPFAVMFLRNIYDLTTFKIIPPEIMK